MFALALLHACSLCDEEYVLVNLDLADISLMKNFSSTLYGIKS